MLTRKQHELLSFVNERLTNTGISPSFEEMKEALGLRSKSGVHRLITALEERGFIRRLPHRARALEVIRLAEQQGAPVAREPRGAVALNVIETNFMARKAPASDDGDAASAGAIEVPLYGRIAAGTPIEALQNNLGTVGIPASMLGNGDYYALEIAGDSMIDAGILDGDLAIIERRDTADNGAIVVALIDREEATLKRLRRRGNSVALEPANKTYETRIFGPDRVEIQGRLTSIIRRY